MQVEIITLSSMSPELLKNKKILVRCKDCIHYSEPEYGYTKGDCRFHTAWYPVSEDDYCSKAKQKTNVE